MIIKNTTTRKEEQGQKSLIISSGLHPLNPTSFAMSWINISKSIFSRSEQDNRYDGEVIILRVSDRLKGKDPSG